MKQTENRKHRLLWFVGLVLLMVTIQGQSSFAQTANLTGVVKDAATGEPMPGVNIIIEGTTTGTSTGRDGEFKISAGMGQVLRFDYLGYDTERITVGIMTHLEVSLRESAHSIDAVVVTMGYGANVTKADAIGAVVTLSADQIQQRAPVNVFEAMRGTMPGVRITSNSGAPGDGVSIRVRGITTFEEEGTEPLYIVDGFIVDEIGNINVNDIESINVLKDGASAAIYGARAASGVVMITTKSGKEGKTKIDVSYIQKFGYISNTLPQLNRKEAYIMANSVISYTGKDQFAWLSDVTDSVSMSNYTSYFYQDLISQVAKTSQLNVSASGGGQQMKYNASAGFLNDKGIILNSRNQRFNTRFKTDYMPSKNFRMSTNVALSYENKDAIDESNVFYNATRRMPQTMIYFPTDGNYVAGWQSYPNTNKRNPILEVNEREDNLKKYQATINQQVVVTLIEGLTFTGNAKANFYYSERERFNSPWIQGYDGHKDGQSTLRLDDVFYQNYSLEGFFNYNTKFGEDHNFSAMFGSAIERKHSKTTTTSASYLISENLRVPQASSFINSPAVNGTGNSIASFFGRVAYDYKKRYLVSFTLRHDGSSVFGPSHRWGTFPSVQLGWRVSDYLKGTLLDDYIHSAKLRFSYGITGNDRIGNYDAQSLYNVSLSNGYYNSVGVMTNTTVGNPDLKWEQTAERNYGLDLMLLGGRVNFEADYYVQKTTDLLDAERIPSELGYASMRVNVGSIRNKGVELGVTAYPVDTRDWTWTTSLNWSKNKNKVLKLAGDGARIYNSNWWVEEGKSAGQFYGFKQLGVYAYDANNAYTADFSERLNPVFQRDSRGNVMFDAQQKPVLLGYTYQNGEAFVGTPSKLLINGAEAQGGDVIWDDVNRDGNITDDDKQVLGSGHPLWFGGWNNSVRWKNITFSFSLYYSHGGLIYNALLFDLTKYGDNTSAADPRGITQGWRYQGQLTKWHIPGNNGNNGRSEVDNNRGLNSFYLEDASFLRLQDVRLAYDFAPDIAKKVGMRSLQVYVYGGNLLTWTKYSGYDPELSNGGVLNPGQDSNKYPRKREVGFGLIVGF